MFPLLLYTLCFPLHFTNACLSSELLSNEYYQYENITQHLKLQNI